MAVAQTFPDQRGPHVNDYADILSDEAEARIAADLDPTLRDHGAQVTIVTLTELRFYTNDLAIADYARGLFDDWQLGQADGSTAILLLILRDDQEMHIRLGEAYDSDWNMTAARVVGEVITPSFGARCDFEALGHQRRASDRTTWERDSSRSPHPHRTSGDRPTGRPGA